MERKIVFKIKKGTHYKNEKKDITITDMEVRQKEKIDKLGRKYLHNEKWYKYTCGICGWTEGWMPENSALKEIGCSCCHGNIVVQGINDIPTTTPWLIPYFQGGIEEAKLYTKTGSGNPNNRGGKILPICPDCGRIKDKPISINNIYRTHSIGCVCSDKSSYCEKLMLNVLEQLNINLKIQLNKQDFKWCSKYKYDFYFELNAEQYIIETHGNQHYGKGFDTCGGDSIYDVKRNDEIKKELALKNGIKEENYIVIDCRYSELEFIKQNISNSRLDKLFDLNKIDWLQAEKFALSNKLKIACEYKKLNPNISTMEIANNMNISPDSVRIYLKRGTIYGWCNYDPQDELKRGRMKNIGAKRHPRQTEIFKDDVSLGIFNSASELARKSDELFGVVLKMSSIAKVCNGLKSQYKGFVFKYISN